MAGRMTAAAGLPASRPGGRLSEAGTAEIIAVGALVSAGPKNTPSRTPMRASGLLLGRETPGLTSAASCAAAGGERLPIRTGPGQAATVSPAQARCLLAARTRG